MDITFCAVLSLITLILVIVIACIKKINPGMLGIAGAFLLGFFVKSEGRIVSLKSAATLIKGFNYSLWLTIMLVSLFFAIASENKTIEKMTGKLLMLFGNSARLMPLLFMLLAVFLTSIGGYSATIAILLTPISAKVAKQMGVPYLLCGILVSLGCSAGSCSPISSNGLIAVNLAAAQGIDVGLGVYFYMLACTTVTAAILYFALGGHKVVATGMAETADAPFTTEQKLTLVCMILFVAATMLLNLDAGMVAVVLSVAQIAFGKYDEQKLIGMIPWPTLFMIGGMSILVHMMTIAGGLDMIIGFFRQFMNGSTAPAMMSLVSSLMSVVSSPSGVVMPTLIPTAGALAQTTGASGLAIISCIAFGAFQSALSPLSTAGGIMLAFGSEAIDFNKGFKQLFLVAGAAVVLGVIYGLVFAVL